MSKKPLPRWKRVAFRCATLALTLALLEGALQIASLASSRVEWFLASGTRGPLADPVLGTRPNPALPDHDAAGWRNAERPARASIVAIGDSQTWGVGASLESTWPARLAVFTGRSTYNISLGGYGPAEYWLLADEAAALEPRLVLVGLYAGNDLAEAYRVVYREGRAQELRSRDPEVLGRIREAEATLPDLAEGWNRTGATRQGAWAKSYRWVGRGIRDLKLYALVRAAGNLIEADRGLRPDASRTDWDRYVREARGVEPDLLFPFREGGVGTVLTSRARVALVDTEDPRIACGLRVTIDAVLRLRDRFRDSAEVAVVLIPTKELVFAERVLHSGTAAPAVYDRLVERETRMWREVRAALDVAGVRQVDTLAALRDAIARNENPYQMDADGHPNRAGYDAIARAVASSPVVRDLDTGP